MIGYAGFVSPPALRVAVVAVGLAAALYLSGCGASVSGRRDEHPTHTAQPVIAGEPAGYNADDAVFADNMLARDQQGVELSALVPDHSADPDVAALAANCAAARQSDMATLKVLRVQWDENPDTKADGDGHRSTPSGTVDDATTETLNALHGSQFDVAWLRSMIKLGQGSVALGKAETANGKNIDAIGVAKRIVEVRQAEINQMYAMLGG